MPVEGVATAQPALPRHQVRGAGACRQSRQADVYIGGIVAVVVKPLLDFSRNFATRA